MIVKSFSPTRDSIVWDMYQRDGKTILRGTVGKCVWQSVVDPYNKRDMNRAYADIRYMFYAQGYVR